MNYLTNENIDYIYSDVQKKGITMTGLLNEMVDHICCCIEIELKKGNDFQTAYNNLMNTVEDSTFKNLQHQDLLSTNLKFQNMKKAMFLTGLIGTLLLFMGVMFKIQHWPGAGICMVLGVFSIVFGFLPMFFYTSYVEQVEKKNVFLYILGYLTLIFLLLGPLFKIMHWPLTDILFYYGPLTLAALFLPVYLVSVFRKVNETKTNFIFIIVILGIGYTSLFMLTSGNVSLEVIYKCDSTYHQNLKITGLFAAKNDSLIAKLQGKQQIETVKANAVALKNEINDLMLKMIHYANPDASTEIEIKSKGNKKACRKIMDQDDNTMKLNDLLQKFRNSLLTLAKDDFQKQIIDAHTDFNLFNNISDYSNFKNYTLIEALATLSSIQKNLQISEFEILTSIN